jgi:hypothetical protein
MASKNACQGLGLRRRRLHGQAVSALQELEARVRALTRRGMGGARPPPSSTAHLVYDQTGRVATIDGKMVELSAREFGLLEVLLQRSWPFGEQRPTGGTPVRVGRRGEQQRDRGIHPPLAQEDRKRPDPHCHGAGFGLLPRKDPRPKHGDIRTPLAMAKLFQARATLAVWRDTWIGCSRHCSCCGPSAWRLTWLVAQNIAGRPFDRGLEYNVQALAQLVKSERKRACISTCHCLPARSCAPTMPT